MYYHSCGVNEQATYINFFGVNDTRKTLRKRLIYRQEIHPVNDVLFLLLQVFKWIFVITPDSECFCSKKYTVWKVSKYGVFFWSVFSYNHHLWKDIRGALTYYAITFPKIYTPPPPHPPLCNQASSLRNPPPSIMSTSYEPLPLTKCIAKCRLHSGILKNQQLFQKVILS